MNLFLAKHLGFCPGVEAVVDLTKASLDLANKENKKLYCIGSLVHNQVVRDSFLNQGVIFLSWESDFEKLERGFVIISAHGVTEAIERKLRDLGFKIIDGTCKKIKANRKIIKKYATQGYYLVLVGIKAHSEVRALVGTELFPGVNVSSCVISSTEEIKNLPKQLPLLVIAQTTFEYSKYKTIVDEIRKQRENTKILNTLCSEVIDRRKEIDSLLKDNHCDLALVVGGRKSANTASLVEKAKSTGTKTLQIDEQTKLLPLKDETIAIFSGASTPKSQIDLIVKELKGE